MKSNSRMFRVCSYAITVLFFVVTIMSISLGIKAMAEEKDIITTAFSEYVSKDKQLRARMEAGTITIVAKNKKADKEKNYTKWRTLGFYITTKPLETYTYKGYTGYKMPDAKSNKIGSDFLYDNSAFCVPDVVPDGKYDNGDERVKATYFFSKESTFALLRGSSNPIDIYKIKKDTTLYLQPIWQAYHVDGDGKEKTLDGCDMTKDWKTIFNAAPWGKPSDFAKYYNIALDFSPGEQYYDVTYLFEDKDGKKKNKLTKRIISSKKCYTNQKLDPIKESLEYYNEEDEMDYYYDRYYATSYYKNEKGTYDEITEGISAKKSKDKITINAIAPYGGMKIYVVFKENEALEPNMLVRELVDRTRIGPDEKLASTVAGNPVSWDIKKSQVELVHGEWTVCSNEKGPNVYDLIAVYVEDSDGGKVDIKNSKGKVYKELNLTNSTLNDLMKNSVNTQWGGMTVHLVYNNDSGNTYHSWVREWENGTKFDQGQFKDPVKAGEKLSYQVKPHLKKVSDEKYKEVAEAKDTNDYFHLKRVYITNKKNKTILNLKKDEVTIKKLCNNGVKLKEEDGSCTVHYVYEAPLEPITPKEPDPEPEIPEVIVPAADEYQIYYQAPEVTGVIRADDRGSEKFNVEQGVATTESLFVNVVGTKYTLGCDLEKKVGKLTFSVKVTQPITFIYKDALGEETIETTMQSVGSVQIERAYGYWEINSLNYYTIDHTQVMNYALPDGEVTIAANSSQNPIPSISYTHTAGIDAHVKYPSAYYSGVTLPMITCYGENEKPTCDVSIADKKAYVNSQVGELIVSNDSLTFDGNTVIPAITCEYDTGSINKDAIYPTSDLCNQEVLYQNDYVIDAKKLNGVYYSGGIIYYRQVAGVNSMANMLSYAVNGLNDVIIHTPVLCNPIVSSDNDQYVQLISPDEDYVQLVLDEDPTLNDLTMHISNIGLHSNVIGYYTRDFSYNLHGGGDASYIQEKNGILRNEVKFPFDIYLYKADGTKEYVKKNTWLVIGRASIKIHIPMWVNEGKYTVECRTVAVNCTESAINTTEHFANTQRENYVATNTFGVEVSGRIYGMKIYDITDYPIWEEAFKQENSNLFKCNRPDKYLSGVGETSYSKDYIYNYTAGTKDQYGKNTGRLSKYTFPLVDGDHPYYKNIGTLKKGYAFRYRLESTGNLYSDASKVVIKPSFWFVDRDGKNRRQVDLYYAEDINGKYRKLVKVGSTLDKINLKEIRTGDDYLGIPKNELELTATLRNTPYKKFVSQMEGMYTFGNIKLNYAYRTFANQDYTKKIQGSKYAKEIANEGITAGEMDIRKQHWYGEYYIPGNAMAVESGLDIHDYASKRGVTMKEDFWLKDGYIIVNFDIYTIDQNGNQRLSYTNAENYLNKGKCCMWITEGFQLEKTDYSKKTFSFKYGDVMVYDATKCVHDDYRVGGTY